jgi:hypothetical protein
VRIEFTYERPPEYFQDPGAGSTGQPTTPRYVFAALIGGAGVAAAVVPGAPGGVVAGGGLIAGALLLSWMTRRAARAHVSVPPGATTARRWVITDDGLASSTAVTSVEYAWPAFRSLTVWPQAYLLLLDRRTHIDIPRGPLTPDDDRALRAVLRGHRLLRGPG